MIEEKIRKYSNKDINTFRPVKVEDMGMYDYVKEAYIRTGILILNEFHIRTMEEKLLMDMMKNFRVRNIDKDEKEPANFLLYAESELFEENNCGFYNVVYSPVFKVREDGSQYFDSVCKIESK